MHQAIARLPIGQREIVERFFVRGESQAGIASALGIAEGTVASRVCRARQRLRVQLAHWHSYPVARSMTASSTKISAGAGLRPSE